MTDCVICNDEISETTGRTTLGCRHEFHTKCIVRWLQKPDGGATCPCCRREPGEMERIVSPVLEDPMTMALQYIRVNDMNAMMEEMQGVEIPPNQAYDETPLMIAARLKDAAEVQRLLAEGADVNEKDSDGDTALQWAEDEDCRKILIDAGADVCLLRPLWRTEGERTKDLALMAACEYDSPLCVKILLDMGANPNYSAPNGKTPLITAIQIEASLSVLDLLFYKGANVFQVDHIGWNAFMWFADTSGDISVMESLLRAAGGAFNPKSAEITKIQALWRGYSVRSLHETAKALLSL